MNFVGHIAVGASVADDTGFLVGTAAPDFASMARTRLRGGAAGAGALADGIALHHATDRAFHADEWFLAMEHELRVRLLADGLPDGGARACAHVGVELLLDGVFVHDAEVHHAVARVYEAIGEPSDAVVDLAEPHERVRWHEHLVGISQRLDPMSYSDTDAVGRRLHTIASRRPRLAFPSTMIDVVCEQLRALQPRIRDDAPTVLQRTARAADIARTSVVSVPHMARK